MNTFSRVFSVIVRIRICVLIFVLVVTSACNRISVNDTLILSKSDNRIITNAQKIKIEKLTGYKKITINNPWQGAENVELVYNLVNRDSVIPAELNSSEVILVPVRNIVCMSTTHIAMISALGEANSISGVSGPEYVYSENLMRNIEAGKVADVGFDSGLNKELILSISPDLIMMYGIGSESAAYVGKIKELGIKVLFNADYLETDPLGKAEWIKLFGALYCKDSLADSIFKSEVNSYDSIKSYISENTRSRPKILLGLPYKDTWFISPGNSFISRLITDAGGDYLWKETESSVSMPFGIENVYLRALNADYWLNIGSVRSGTEIETVDSRLIKLPCFINGNIFNNNSRTTLKGGNDYWESGTVYPHLILKDIATIIHPEIFSTHDLFFYRKLD